MNSKQTLSIFVVMTILFIGGGVYWSQFRTKQSTKRTTRTHKKTSPCEDILGIDLPPDCAGIVITKPYVGLSNFRTFTPDRKKKIPLQQKKIYRSDALYKMTEQDIKKLEQLGIKTIIDLRSSEEIAEHPNKKVGTVVHSFNFPIGNDPAKLEKLGISKDDMKRIKTLFISKQFAKVDAFLKSKHINIRKSRIERYQEFATAFNHSVAQTLKVLADETKYPILFHCHGGKDRTGFISALILSIVGYSQEDIIRDYLTTNLYTYSNLRKQYSLGVNSLKPAYGAHREQILASLEQVKKSYGSIDQYLTQTLKLSPQELIQIRRNLLVMKSIQK